MKVVGDESVIRFRDFQGIQIEEATTSVSLSLPSLPSKQGTEAEDSKMFESDYNVELGVYHENEISG